MNKKKQRKNEISRRFYMSTQRLDTSKDRISN